jgi:thioredoxin reductase (NADPH)
MQPLVAIVGGGPAGLSAALWCRRLGLETLLFESRPRPGGQLWEINNPIGDLLGVRAAHGRDLLQQILALHEGELGEYRYACTVERISLDRGLVLHHPGGRLAADAVIVATGVRRRPLEASGAELLGPGQLSYSATGDHHLGVGRTVAVLGGGDGAVENALILAERAAHVHLIHRGRRLSARRNLRERLAAEPRITVHLDAPLRRVEPAPQGVLLELATHPTTVELQVATLFIKIGYLPNSELCRGLLPLDPRGFIPIDARCETAIPGLLAAGDVCNPLAPCIAAAIGHGAIAARAAFEHLRRQGFDI